MSPEQLRYAKTHEWAFVEPGTKGPKTATIGISAHAVEALTDLVFMQLPEVGRRVTAGQSIGEIESVKAVSDLYSPVTGQVVAVNTALPDKLETLSQDPYGEGWMVKIEMDAASSLVHLMDYAAYQKQCAEESH